MMIEDWKAELAAMHALGALDDPAELDRAKALESHEDAEFLRELKANREALAALSSISARRPPDSLRPQAVKPAQPELPAGLAALVATGALPWKSSPFAGVSAKKLFKDPQGNVSWMVKLEPGAVYPRHRHTTMEHCLVLEGEVRFDEYVLRAGDYEVAHADTDHSAFVSPLGAVLFIIANQHDEIFH